MTINKKFEKLFEPCNIGRIQTRNRIVKTAAQTYFFEPGEYRVGERAKAFYEALARGGVGLIVVETPAMEYPLHKEGDRRFRIDDDKYIKEVSELTKVIHKHNCPVFVQFYHRGPWGGVYALMAPPVAASAVTIKSEFDVHEDTPPRALTIIEIKELVDRFAGSAVRAAKAGFDGVEIHTGSDNLLPTFLSRFWNKRTDEYGAQNMENRTRFVVEIIREVKKRLGEDFPVQVLMNGIEIGGGDEGITIEEAKVIAIILEKAGADSLHIRSHFFGQHQASSHNELLFYPEPYFKSFPKEMDWSRTGALSNVPMVDLIKKKVSIPVMTVGGFDAESGEMVLRQGKADLIGMTRRLFADPELPNKIAAGKFEDIAPCTQCGNCMKVYNQPRQCRINASFGKEQYIVEKALKKKKVLVVGGGPAGAQAARIAAMRGHDVTLFEQHYLGGSMPLAGMIKGFKIENLNLIIHFFKIQLKKFGVKVKLGSGLETSDIDKLKPDTIVLALGGSPTLPDVPGLDGHNVIKNTDLYSLLKFFIRFIGPRFLRFLTNFWMPIGKNVIIIGGAIHGCQLGEFLIKRGRKVTIVDTEEEPGKWLAPERKTRLFHWFKKKGVELISGIKLEEITPKGLSIITKEGKKRFLPADNIIPATPYKPNLELANNIKGKVKEVYTIGDCADPAIIPDAISAGWEVGNKI